MNVRIKLGVVAASVAALALSACGSSSLSGRERRVNRPVGLCQPERGPCQPSCLRASRTLA